MSCWPLITCCPARAATRPLCLTVQTTLLVRTSGPVFDPTWAVSEVGLEDLVLAYMKQAAGPAPRNNHRHLEVQK